MLKSCREFRRSRLQSKKTADNLRLCCSWMCLPRNAAAAALGGGLLLYHGTGFKGQRGERETQNAGPSLSGLTMLACVLQPATPRASFRSFSTQAAAEGFNDISLFVQ
jgi:hypothetical protein